MNLRLINMLLAKAIALTANVALVSAANSMCYFVFHQPKQNEKLRRFRKF